MVDLNHGNHGKPRTHPVSLVLAPLLSVPEIAKPCARCATGRQAFDLGHYLAII